MSWLDIVILVVVAVATLFGWKTGLIRAAATLVGLVGGVYLASVYHEQAATLLEQFISSERLATIGGYGLLFVGAMVVAFVLGSVVRRVLRLLFLGWVDTVAGAGVGFAISVGLLMALLIPLEDTSLFGLGETIRSSSLASLIVNAAPQVQAVLPDGFDRMTGFLSRN